MSPREPRRDPLRQQFVTALLEMEQGDRRRVALALLREEQFRGLGVREMGQRYGAGKSTVSDWLTGKYQPSSKAVEAIISGYDRDRTGYAIMDGDLKHVEPRTERDRRLLNEANQAILQYLQTNDPTLLAKYHNKVLNIATDRGPQKIRLQLRPEEIDALAEAGLIRPDTVPHLLVS